MKNHGKILFRNPMTLFFILLLPFIVPLSLNANFIQEKGDLSDGYTLYVKIMDQAASPLSKTLISQLEESGNLHIGLYTGPSLNLEEARAYFEKDVNYGYITYLYLTPDFDEKLLEDKNGQAIYFFQPEEDERERLVEGRLKLFLQEVEELKQAGVKESFAEELQVRHKQKEAALPQGTFVYVDKEGESRTTYNSYSFSFNMFVWGMLMAFSLSTLMGFGVINKEREEGLLRRLLLTPITVPRYLLSRTLVVMGLIGMQLLVMALGIIIWVKVPLVLSILQIICLMGFMGVILVTFTLWMEVLSRNQQKVQYGVCFILLFSNLITGLSFSMDTAPRWMQNIAILFPQRWVTYTVERLEWGETYALVSYGGVMLIFASFFGLLASVNLYFMQEEGEE